MKTPLETARRWLAQAEHSLIVSRSLLEGGFSPEACFHAEQTSQIALKAFLYLKGRRFVNIHSVRQLAIELEEAGRSSGPPCRSAGDR